MSTVYRVYLLFGDMANSVLISAWAVFLGQHVNYVPVKMMMTRAVVNPMCRPDAIMQMVLIV